MIAKLCPQPLVSDAPAGRGQALPRRAAGVAALAPHLSRAPLLSGQMRLVGSNGCAR